MAKLTETAKQKMRDMYSSGTFTRRELSTLFTVTSRTVDRTLHGLQKPFRYDALNRSVPIETILYTEPAKPLTGQAEYVKIVECPEKGCLEKMTARKLLLHLIKVHHRYDLEYLL